MSFSFARRASVRRRFPRAQFEDSGERRPAAASFSQVSHIMELHAQGYEFVVLPNGFMVHMPHAPSLDIARFRSSSQYRKCLSLLKGEFARDLSLRYGRTFPASGDRRR